MPKRKSSRGRGGARAVKKASVEVSSEISEASKEPNNIEVVSDSGEEITEQTEPEESCLETAGNEDIVTGVENAIGTERMNTDAVEAETKTYDSTDEASKAVDQSLEQVSNQDSVIQSIDSTVEQMNEGRETCREVTEDEELLGQNDAQENIQENEGKDAPNTDLVSEIVPADKTSSNVAAAEEVAVSGDENLNQNICDETQSNNQLSTAEIVSDTMIEKESKEGNEQVVSGTTIEKESKESSKHVDSDATIQKESKEGNEQVVTDEMIENENKKNDEELKVENKNTTDETLEPISLNTQNLEEEPMEAEIIKEDSDEEEDEIQYVDEEADEEQHLLDVMSKDQCKKDKNTESLGHDSSEKFALGDKSKQETSKFEEISEGSIDEAEQEEMIKETFSDVEIIEETVVTKNKNQKKTPNKKEAESLEEVFFATENNFQMASKDKENDDISDGSFSDHANTSMSLEEISDDDVEISRKKKKSSEPSRNESSAKPTYSSESNLAALVKDSKPDRTSQDKENPEGKENNGNCSKNYPSLNLETDGAVCSSEKVPSRKSEESESRKQEILRERTGSQTAHIEPHRGSMNLQPKQKISCACQTEPRQKKGKIVQCNIKPVQPVVQAVAADRFFSKTMTSSQFLDQFREKLPYSIPEDVIAKIICPLTNQDNQYSLGLGPISFADMASVEFRNSLFKNTDSFTINFDEHHHGVYTAVIKEESVASLIRQLKQMELGNRYMTMSLSYGLERSINGVVTLMYDQDVQTSKQHSSKGDAKLRAKLQLTGVPEGVSKDFVHLLFPEALSITAGPLFDKKRSLILGFSNTKLAQNILLCHNFLVMNEHQVSISALDYVESATETNAQCDLEKEPIVIDDASQSSEENHKLLPPVATESVSEPMDEEDSITTSIITNAPEIDDKPLEKVDPNMGKVSSTANQEQNLLGEVVEISVDEEKLPNFDPNNTKVSPSTTNIESANIEKSLEPELQPVGDVPSKSVVEQGGEAEKRSIEVSAAPVNQETVKTVAIEIVGETEVSRDGVQSPSSISPAVLEEIQTVSNKDKELTKESEKEKEAESLISQGNEDKVENNDNLNEKKDKEGNNITLVTTLPDVSSASQQVGEKPDGATYSPLKEAEEVNSNRVAQPMETSEQVDTGGQNLEPLRPLKTAEVASNQDDFDNVNELLDSEPVASKSLEDVSDDEMACQDKEEVNAGDEVIVLREDSSTTVIANIDLTIEESTGSDAEEKSAKSTSIATALNESAVKVTKKAPVPSKPEGKLLMTDNGFEIDMEVIDMSEEENDEEKIIYARRPSQQSRKRARSSEGKSRDSSQSKTVRSSEKINTAQGSPSRHDYSSQSQSHTRSDQMRYSIPTWETSGLKRNYNKTIKTQIGRRSPSPELSNKTSSWSRDVQPQRQGMNFPISNRGYYPPVQPPYPYRPPYSTPEHQWNPNPGYAAPPPPSYYSYPSQPPNYSHAPGPGPDRQSGYPYYQQQQQQHHQQQQQHHQQQQHQHQQQHQSHRDTKQVYEQIPPAQAPQYSRGREFQVSHYSHKEKRRSPPKPRHRSRSHSLSDMSLDSHSREPPSKKPYKRVSSGGSGLVRKVSRSPISVSSRSRSLSPVSCSPSPDRSHFLRKRNEVVKSVKQFLHAAKGFHQLKGKKRSSPSRSPPPQHSSSIRRTIAKPKSSNSPRRQVLLGTSRHGSGSRPKSPPKSYSHRTHSPPRRSRNSSPTRTRRISYKHRSPSPVSSESSRGSPAPPPSGRRRDYHQDSSVHSRKVLPSASLVKHSHKTDSRYKGSGEPIPTVASSQKSSKDHSREKSKPDMWGERQWGKNIVAETQSQSRYHTAPTAMAPSDYTHYSNPAYAYSSPYPAGSSGPSPAYSVPPPPNFNTGAYQQHSSYSGSQHHYSTPETYGSSGSAPRVQDAYQQAYSLLKTALGELQQQPQQTQQSSPYPHNLSPPRASSSSQPGPAASAKTKSWSMGSNAIVFQRILGNEGKKKK